MCPQFLDGEIQDADWTWEAQESDRSSDCTMSCQVAMVGHGSVAMLGEFSGLSLFKMMLIDDY